MSTKGIPINFPGVTGKANHEVMGDRRFDSLKYWIVDSLSIDGYLLEERDAVIAAAHDIGAQRYNPNMLMIFVTTNSDHRRNIQKYMEVLHSQCNWKAKLFKDMESTRLSLIRPCA